MPIEYKDLKFRIVASVLGAHIFTVYGEPESSLEWLLRKDYYPAFAISLFIALAVTAYIRWVTQKLDNRYLWERKVSDRIVLQVVLGIICPALFAFFFTGLYLHLRDVNILKTTYVTHDFQFLCLILLLINAYYLAYYFYHRWQQAEQKAISYVAPEVPAIQQSITVSRGSKNFPIAVTDIAVIYRQDEVNYLRTFDAEKYFLPLTLDDLIQQLDQSFFRVNRQVIISRRALASYKNTDFGKIQLLLIGDLLDAPIIVSQKRAKGFREWVQ